MAAALGCLCWAGASLPPVSQLLNLGGHRFLPIYLCLLLGLAGISLPNVPSALACSWEQSPTVWV